MLPSMPIICSTSSQEPLCKDENLKIENNDNANIDEKLFGCVLSKGEISSAAFDSLPKDEKECDDELVLIAENSPFSEKRKLLAQVSQPKKKKKVDINHIEETIDDYSEHLAEAYFSKAKSILDEQTFQKFIAVLSEAVDEPGSAVALYHKIVEILADYPDLIDDFVGFLHPHQAQECGKFMDYKFFEKCWTFLRKLEAHHMNRFMNSLEHQIKNRSPSSETLKSSLLPLLKGHQHLSDSFLQLLPDEKPPPCSKEDYEDISETSIEDGDWERLTIAEHPERGSCQNCACKCHTAPSHPFCIVCNIKFINGQIYVQHGKVLRFARVTFGDVPQMEMLEKLHPSFYSKRRKKRKSSTSKAHNVGGSKESNEQEEIPLREIKCEPEEPEDDVGDYGNSGITDVTCAVEERQDEEDDYWEEESSGGEKSLDSEITSDPDTCDSTRLIGMVTPVSPLANTQDCSSGPSLKTTELLEKESLESNFKTNVENSEKNEILTPSIEIKDEIKENIEINEKLPQTIEIQDKIKEQTENSEINEKLSQNVENKDEMKEWTREEDKMILQAFQKEIGTEQTFSKICNLMPSRTLDDIQGRFKVLMNLLEKMASGSQNT